MRDFKDTSIFQNMKEWTDGPRLFRAEYSQGNWRVFEIENGFSGFICTIRGGQNMAPRQIAVKAGLLGLSGLAGS